MTHETVTAALFTIYGLVAVAQYLMLIATLRIDARARRALDVNRRLVADFAEAMALFQYGARDEAAALAKAAAERHAREALDV